VITWEKNHKRATIHYSHGSQPRPGWAPDTPMVGIRSPTGLVVGSCTSHPGVLGSIPKREEPGKTAHPVSKYRVPHGSQCVMGRLIHTGLGSSSLIAHVLHSPPPPREQLCNRSCSNKTHTPSGAHAESYPISCQFCLCFVGSELVALAHLHTRP